MSTYDINTESGQFLEDGMVPLTFTEWIRVQNEVVNYEIEVA